MIESTDQLGRQVQLAGPAQRIVSLVPSQTELLCDLGLQGRLVGITRYCTHPPGDVTHIEQIAGTKNPDCQRIIELRPDLVIANREENRAEDVQMLATHCPVWVSDVATLEDALDMIEAVGRLTDRQAQASQLAGRISTGFAQLPPIAPRRAAYLVWRKPWMVAGGGTFIDAMLVQAGFTNVFADRSRYPSADRLELQTAAPEFVLLSSEPFPFQDRHRHELQALLPAARVEHVDGRLFSWYGSQLLHAPAGIRALRRQLGLVTTGH